MRRSVFEVAGVVGGLMAQASAGTSSGAGSGATGATPQAIGPQNGAAWSSAAGGRPILTPGYLQAHRVGIPNQKDVIWNPIFDFLNYPYTGVSGLALSFFSNQQGQGSSSAPGFSTTTPKTQFDTNLQSPNAFTLGQEFYVISSETLWFPGVGATSVGSPTGTTNAINFGLLNVNTTAGTLDLPKFPTGASPTANAQIGQEVADTWMLYNVGFKSLKVGTDRYYIQDGPLGLFPPKNRLALAAALAATPPSTAGEFVVEEAYAVASGEPYLIVPIYLQSTQLFTVAYTFPGAIPTPSGYSGRIGERLGGYLIRQAT